MILNSETIGLDFVAETMKMNWELLQDVWLTETCSEMVPYTFPNFFDKDDARFKKLHVILDSVFQKLRAGNVESGKKSAKPFPKNFGNDIVAF